MGRSWRFDWIPLLFAAVCLLGIVQLVHYGRHLGRPFPGFTIDRELAANSWQVGPGTPPWWEGIAGTGLRPGDRLLAIDGHRYGRDHAERYAAAHAAGRSTVVLTVARGQGAAPKQITAPLVPFRLAHALDLKLPGLITGFGFLALAVAVYAAWPGHPVNRLFAVGCTLVVAHRWFIDPGLFVDEGGVTNVLALAHVVAAPFLPPATIHLALRFPRPSPRLSRRLLAVLYGAGALMAVGYVAARFIFWTGGWTPAVRWLDHASYHASLLLLGGATLVFVFRYIVLRRRSQPGTRVHRQVSVILTGFILTSPFVAQIILDGFIAGRSYYLAGLNLRFLLLAVPLAFAYAILRYQTFRSRQPALLGVFIFGSSALVASIGDWLVRLALGAPTAAFSVPPFVPIFAVTFGVGTFWSTQSSWRGVFGRLLYRRTRSHHAARRFAQRLVGYLDGGDLPQRIASALVEELELEQAAVWLLEGEDEPVLAGRAGTWSSPLPERLPLATGDVAAIDTPLRLTPAAARWKGLRPLARQGDLEVVAPLRVTERPLGLLALGRRWDEEIFDERDLEIVVLVAQQAALFVLAARQIAELRQVPQRMAEAQEQERRRIARELHDTIQQSLGRLPFYLEVSRTSLRHDPEESERLLVQSMADVENAADSVRQIQQNLAPRPLEHGLSKPLRDLAGRFGARTGVEVEVAIGPGVDEALPLRTRHALYRVVQQALDNVAAHASAGRVLVDVVCEAEGVAFRIADDGQGSSTAERRAAGRRGSFGMHSMRARVRSQGGAFNVRSAPGEGTVISGWLPSANDAGASKL